MREFPGEQGSKPRKLAPSTNQNNQPNGDSIMKTTKLAACSLSRACVLGRFFTGLRLWRGWLGPIGEGYGRSTDAVGSIRPIATNLVPAAVGVANSNERRSLAAFMNFNSRGRKMKPKLVFRFMPKMWQGRNGMAKAMKLLMLLLVSGLISAPAHGECYTEVGLGEYRFQKFGWCEPFSVGPWNGIDDAAELRSAYESMWDSCYGNIKFKWSCPVNQRYRNANQIQSAWQRQIAECRQFVTNQYNKYNGRMCHDE